MKPLKKGERCPIHGGYFCCGREKPSGIQQRKGHTRIAPGVEEVTDSHHPNKKRILRTPAAMRALLIIKVREQDGLCALCHEPLEDMRYVEADHIDPRGMGGSRRDDSPDNIQATHRSCNREKGSKRFKEADRG